MAAPVDVSELQAGGYVLDRSSVDPYARGLFAQIFTGMQGRYTRLRIIKALTDQPTNVNRLARLLDRDYKTIKRNVAILERSQLIEKTGEGYGSEFRVTDLLLKNLGALDHVLQRVDRRLSRKKTYIS